jgi:hypothetical protein
MVLRAKSGFTLLDMLTTVAGLVIVLGMMMSLARYVRGRSAETLTRRVLGQLDRLVAQNPDLQGRLRGAPALMEGVETDRAEEKMLANATENSQWLVKVWLKSSAGDRLTQFPITVFDRKMLRDTWGTPIVYLPAGSSIYGMAPMQRSFFVSAGPDRKFSTLLDNIYSYDRRAPWEQ